MNALRASLRRRGLGCVRATAATMVLLCAGGLLAFEPAHEVEGGFAHHGAAVWWTGMRVAIGGSESWPQTAEGRTVCFQLALDQVDRSDAVVFRKEGGRRGGSAAPGSDT